MIVDDLALSSKYASLHPRFKAAFDFLTTQPLENLSLGKHTIDGENIDGLQGEWTIIFEEKEENDKEIVIITIEKKEIE